MAHALQVAVFEVDAAVVEPAFDKALRHSPPAP